MNQKAQTSSNFTSQTQLYQRQLLPPKVLQPYPNSYSKLPPRIHIQFHIRLNFFKHKTLSQSRRISSRTYRFVLTRNTDVVNIVIVAKSQLRIQITFFKLFFQRARESQTEECINPDVCLSAAKLSDKMIFLVNESTRIHTQWLQLEVNLCIILEKMNLIVPFMSFAPSLSSPTSFSH